MKILIGLIAALLLAVGVLWWRLDVAALRATAAETRASTAETALLEQTEETRKSTARFDALDKALEGLDARTRSHNAKLDKTLNRIDAIQRTPDDTEESMRCLDVLVPRQLDDSLLHRP